MDYLPSPVWGNTDGSQHFPDFADSISSHSEDAEEYVFRSGNTTPKGSRRDYRSMDQTWIASRTVQPPSSQAMSRANSGRSVASSLSQNSQMSSHMVSRGNDLPAFRNGSQGAASMVGMTSALMLDSELHAVPSQMSWPYDLGMNLGADHSLTMGSVEPLHISPAQMQLGPDSIAPDNSSPGSLDHLSSTISRTPSPGTDDAWLQGPISPHVSPDIKCQSPQTDRSAMEYFPGADVAHLEDHRALSHPFIPRRAGSDGESARDHALYKVVSPGPDGLYHCPWEGDATCNHKPEKLKCNYDKYVDSHLKPYRCKIESCEAARFSSTACLLRHEREAHGLHGHGDKPFQCTHPGCERALPGNGFPRQWNLRDHMKRVHNDRGVTGTSPPSGSSQAGKSRKRKTEVAEAQPASSRKATVKSMPPPEPKVAAEKPLIEQWINTHKAAQDTLREIGSLDGANTLEQITKVQKQLDAMTKMAQTAKTTKRCAAGASRKSYITG